MKWNVIIQNAYPGTHCNETSHKAPSALSCYKCSRLLSCLYFHCYLFQMGALLDTWAHIRVSVTLIRLFDCFWTFLQYSLWLLFVLLSRVNQFWGLLFYFPPLICYLNPIEHLRCAQDPSYPHLCRTIGSSSRLHYQSPFQGSYWEHPYHSSCTQLYSPLRICLRAQVIHCLTL